MTTDRIPEPSDTLREVLRLAENIKIAYELVEEKSPKGDKKLNYVFQNLQNEIESLLGILYGTTKTPKDEYNYEEADFEVVADENIMEEDEKVL